MTSSTVMSVDQLISLRYCRSNVRAKQERITDTDMSLWSGNTGANLRRVTRESH